jgi:putative chitinase
VIDWKRAQTKLIAAGYDIGTADGIAGRRTHTALLAFVAQRPMAPLEPLGAAMAVHAPAHGITDTVGRLANFLGQAAHETGSFRYLREVWGPTPAQKRYEGRSDLGNNQTGDGYRYRGRGIFQLTGRANYRDIGAAIGQPLEANPELAERPDIAVLTACRFWQSRGLNALADQGLEDTITRRINGGTNGIEERRRFVARMKALLS